MRTICVATLSVMLLTAFCDGALGAEAETGKGFSLDPLFSEGAVLQRDAEIPVSGDGASGARVEVGFDGKSYPATVGDDGRWCAMIGPFAASSTGRELVAECNGERCVATNVLVGEVFLCSGQSNMQQPLWCGGWGGGFSDRKGRIEARIARWPLFRYARIPVGKPGSVPKWKTVDNEATATGVSAISYYFATALLRAEPDIPVGIVNSAVGGSSIDSWLPGETGRLFGNMIAATGSFRFRAVLWYQGEGNVRDGDKYTVKLHALAKGWRDAFGDPSLPFIVSEIAPFDHGKGALSAFWRAQNRFADEDAHAVCVPINDCGDYGTIHPDRKELPAMRYAAIALNRFYGRKDILCDIPRATCAVVDAGAVVVEFSGTSQLGVNSYPKFAKHDIGGFELCGKDGKWHESKAAIEGNKVRVHSVEVPAPVRVRYLCGKNATGELYAADSNFVPSAFEMAAASSVDGELQAKAQALADLAVKEGMQGALQFCAFKDGKCIVDVWAGTMTTNAGAAKIDGNTLFPIFSTEKPMLATAVHRSAERGKLEYDTPVCKYWPEFRGGGKEKLTVRELMGYRSGLPDCKSTVGWNDFAAMSDWKGMLEWYASSKPEIEPGTKQRYMPRSYGWALGGLLEKAWGRPANDILREQMLIPAGIEKDFYFVCGDREISRIATVYNGAAFETMNNDIARRSLLPSAWAVSSARGIAKFYNRLCGFDGQPPLVSKSTLDAALKPCRHESDPLPDAEGLKKWHMIFGMGYGLWGEPDDISRVFGHGGVGGSEGLCDRSQRLVVGYTCNFAGAPPKLREAFYLLVGMRWRYWKDDVNIQDLQMATVAKGNDVK